MQSKINELNEIIKESEALGIENHEAQEAQSKPSKESVRFGFGSTVRGILILNHIR